MTTPQNIPVLIVGAGPVGLTASLLLSRYGIRSVLVERHPGTSTHPRARGFNFRTMEIYRELGLEQPMRAAGADLSRNRGLLIVETLAGAERARIGMEDAFYGGIDAVSPTGWCMCTQNEMEPVLCEAAHRRGRQLRVEAHGGKARCRIAQQREGRSDAGQVGEARGRIGTGNGKATLGTTAERRAGDGA